MLPGSSRQSRRENRRVGKCNWRTLQLNIISRNAIYTARTIGSYEERKRRFRSGRFPGGGSRGLSHRARFNFIYSPTSFPFFTAVRETWKFHDFAHTRTRGHTHAARQAWLHYESLPGADCYQNGGIKIKLNEAGASRGNCRRRFFINPSQLREKPKSHSLPVAYFFFHPFLFVFLFDHLPAD